MEQLVTTVQDRKSGQEVAKNSDLISDKRSQRRFPKTHVGYWKARLEHRTYSHRGQHFEISEWSVRIKHRGIRRSFDLDIRGGSICAAVALVAGLILLRLGFHLTARAKKTDK